MLPAPGANPWGAKPMATWGHGDPDPGDMGTLTPATWLLGDMSGGRGRGRGRGTGERGSRGNRKLQKQIRRRAGKAGGLNPHQSWEQQQQQQQQQQQHEEDAADAGSPAMECDAVRGDEHALPSGARGSDWIPAQEESWSACNSTRTDVELWQALLDEEERMNEDEDDVNEAPLGIEDAPPIGVAQGLSPDFWENTEAPIAGEDTLQAAGNGPMVEEEQAPLQAEDDNNMHATEYTDAQRNDYRLEAYKEHVRERLSEYTIWIVELQDTLHLTAQQKRELSLLKAMRAQLWQKLRAQQVPNGAPQRY